MPRDLEISDEVRRYTLLPGEDLFAELFASVRFESVGKGRLGAVVTKEDETGGIPLVRTTTRYRTPAQRFRAVHERLAQQIQDVAAIPVAFNNALIESYTNAYTTMGSHSDQALDLTGGSHIAVFSSYQHPEMVNTPRKLIVESKGSGGDSFEIPLTHHSVVVFSVDTNRRLRHRIILDASGQSRENQWMGVTFRTAKTVVLSRDGCTYFPDGERLTLADEQQRHEFFQLRRRENNETDFIYPRLTYTISESDLMPLEPLDPR